MSATTAWYYVSNGLQVGPVDIEQLRMAVQNGTIGGSDLVWREGMSDWVAAGSLPELSPAPGILPPPALRPPSVPYAPDPVAFTGYAGFWKRVAAIIIDWFVMFVPTFIAGFVMGFILAANDVPIDDIETAGGLIDIVCYWIYFSVMESSRFQGTLGKLALGIKVTDLDGNRISFGRATGRHFGKIISGFILCIGFLMAAFTQKKQTLHDMMASCLVVNRN